VTRTQAPDTPDMLTKIGRAMHALPALCELLPARTFYPKMVTGPDGNPREESDRWAEAAFLTEQARACFDAAVRGTAASAPQILPMLASNDGRE